MRNADVVYPVLHGGFGEDGTLQKLLEKAGLRFVGSGSASCQLVMDKIATKKLLDKIALPTAPWAVVSRQNREFPGELKFPVMIKAPCEGSTVGILRVNSIEEWDSALDEELKFADELLVEEFVSGAEITVPVINAAALEAIEIVSPSGFYDWDAKYVYNNGQTEYFCPPRSLSEKSCRLAKDYALKFYHASGCRDILRVDFIVTKEGIPYILEGNNLPGNTEHSLVPMAAKQAGKKHRIICMSSDGDLNEGSTWEAIMLAGQHHFDNLTMLVDYNRLQALGKSEDIINLESLKEKLEIFGWQAVEVDGHDQNAVYESLKKLPLVSGKPSAVIFYTVKGKGVSFMENDYKWHYGGLTTELCEKAIKEVEAAK
jgi:D-alanine-D-alanine ligase